MNLKLTFLPLIAALALTSCSTTGSPQAPEDIAGLTSLATVVAIESVEESQRPGIAVAVTAAADAITALTDDNVSSAELNALILRYVGTGDKRIAAIATYAVSFYVRRNAGKYATQREALAAVAEGLRGGTAAYLVTP